METLERLCDAGVSRAVLGTTLVTSPSSSPTRAQHFDGIVAGIDAREGKVAIEGWKQGTEHGVLELIHELELLGVKRVAYTDISQDGTQDGINYGAYRALVDQVEHPGHRLAAVSRRSRTSAISTSIGARLEGVIIGTRALRELVHAAAGHRGRRGPGG